MRCMRLYLVEWGDIWWEPVILLPEWKSVCNSYFYWLEKLCGYDSTCDDELMEGSFDRECTFPDSRGSLEKPCGKR